MVQAPKVGIFKKSNIIVLIHYSNDTNDQHQENITLNMAVG